MFKYIMSLFNRDNKETTNLIDLLDYHYKVDNIYNDIILVDIDIDSLDIFRGQQVKLLNKIYIIDNVEFLPHNKDFKYRLTLTNENN